MTQPEPSWEVFGECPKCFTDEGKPCYSLASRSKNLIPLKEPHRGRKQKKKGCSCTGPSHIELCSQWVLPT